MRGAFPGFGSALRAFLGNGGNLVAYQIAEECAKNNANATVDPWPYFEQVMRDPSTATGMAKDLIGEGFARGMVGHVIGTKRTAKTAQQIFFGV